MIAEDWIEGEPWDASPAGKGNHVGPLVRRTMTGWQLGGVFVLVLLFSPALVTGSARDWGESLVLALVSSPLLAWLLVPLRRSDDRLDEAQRRWAEIVDVLSVVLIWTWPWTCTGPLIALGRCLERLQAGGS